MTQFNSKSAAAHAFATTQWSAVVAAGDSTHGEGRAALERLCQTYWHPLFVFVQRKGVPTEEAKDLTQAFFEDFLERNQVVQADPARGRFRSFLVRSMENFLHNEWRRRSALKRGGGRAPVPLDASPSDPGAVVQEVVGSDTPETAYARQWAQTLLEQAQSGLEQEWAAAGRADLFRELVGHLWSEDTKVPFAELCARFDLTPVHLRVTFHRFRSRYRELLRQAVAATVNDPEEIDDELRFLMRALGR